MCYKQLIISKSQTRVDGCWEWKLRKAATGYGEISVRGKRWYAHRFSYTVFKGEIPDGMVVRHKCDNRGCVNPEHLELGSHADNMKDAWERNNNRKPIQPFAAYRKPNGVYGKELYEWFKTSSIAENESGCWITPRLSKGYISLRSESGKYVVAHRYFYCVFTGLDYEGDFVVRHLCHNKSCIRIDHLTHGTQRDNAIDSRLRYSHVKLTNDDIIRIKEDLARESFVNFGDKNRFDEKWATMLGVSSGCILDVRNGNKWSDIGEIQKSDHYCPRVPRTILRPEIVMEIKSDIPNWDFSIWGSKRKFDSFWAEKLNVRVRCIRGIREGDRWNWVS